MNNNKSYVEKEDIILRNSKKMYQFFLSIRGNLLRKGLKDKILKKFYLLKIALKERNNQEERKYNINFIILVVVLNSLIKVNFIKKRFGRVIKEVPIYINNRRQVSLGVKSIIKFIKGQNNKLIEINKLTQIYYNYKKALENRIFLRKSKNKKNEKEKKLLKKWI